MTNDICPRVSIIVPAYNAEKTLDYCLKSFAEVDYPKDRLQVIVIDNDSSDKTAMIIKSYPVIYAYEAIRTSYAARNRGVKLATGDILAFTDADCIVDKNWVKNGARLLVEDRYDIVGGTVLAYSPSSIIEKYQDYRGSLNSDKTHTRKYFPTCNLFVRKHVFQQVGGFDEHFVSGGDVDFSWRCHAEGYRIKLSKSVLVYHMHRTNFVDLYEQNFRYGYGRHLIKLKYHRDDDDFLNRYFNDTKIYTLWGRASFAFLFLPYKVFFQNRKWPNVLYPILDFVVLLAQITGQMYGLSKKDASPKIVYLPDWRSSNPYQVLLYDELRRRRYRAEGKKALKIFWILKSSFNHDIIHLHWEEGLCCLKETFLHALLSVVSFMIKLRLARIAGLRIVYTMHNHRPHEPKHSRLEKCLKRYVLECCDKVIVHSKAGKNNIISEYNIPSGKIQVIAHGNYIQHYRNDLDQEEAKNRLGIPLNSLVLLFFGQIRPYKGVIELVEAFKELDIPGTKLIIAGKPIDAEYSKRVRSIAESQQDINYIDEFIPDEAVQVYMNACDIVVCPYKKVLTSGSLLLALSFGRYVVAPAMGDIPELVGEDSIYLYNPDLTFSADILKKAILSYDSNYNKEEILKIARKYDWNEIAQQYKNVYEES